MSLYRVSDSVMVKEQNITLCVRPPKWPDAGQSSTKAVLPPYRPGDTKQSHHSYQSDFPQVFFLDHSTFKRSEIGIPLGSISLAPSLLESLQHTDEISKQYFGWAYLWMPIVSRRRWQAHLINPLAALRVDVHLLLYAMGLVVRSPIQQGPKLSPQTDRYLSMKRAFLDAKIAGFLSLQFLQAMWC